jgi:glutathionylspermidine synthase
MTLLDVPISKPQPQHALRASDALDDATFARIRRRMVLDFCKWDPQVGDVCTIAPFALLLSRREWRHLSDASEALARETIELEDGLLDRPDLHRDLGMPRRLRRVLADGRSKGYTPAAARVMRFDFHPTPNGWRISEVNSDVPGGFSEASALPALMSEHLPCTTTAGDPAAAYVDALARQGRTVALLVAPGFMEDHQIVANLARLLVERGCETRIIQPQHLEWQSNRAPFDVIVRFYQAEWLARLPRRIAWQPLFAGGETPVVNPPAAVLSESKRLPLVWDRLGVVTPHWRKFLPETRDPRDVPWRRDDGWLVKSAYCNNGDSVTTRDLTPRTQWLKTSLDILLHPRDWIAQRRFETTPVDTPLGPMRPCIGVYVIDGRACGVYARLSPLPVIRYDAIDVAVLINDDSAEAAE